MLRSEYDPEADALYVHLSELPYAFGEDLDHARRIDYAADGTPVGVELLYVSHGVDLRELPQASDLADVLKQHNIRQFA
jgi:uncharacterized protein YuzE